MRWLSRYLGKTGEKAPHCTEGPPASGTAPSEPDRRGARQASRLSPLAWLTTLNAVVRTCLAGGVLLLLLTLVGVALYGVGRARLTEALFRTRLQQVCADYEQLRGAYNTAVRKTAVTELVVRDGRVSVVVRNITGEVATVDTPYRAGEEVYADFVVADGRLWIRRVFTAAVPPSHGVIIDPDLAAINWDSERFREGKAVYRRLTEGTWTVTVTGAGALGLKRRPDGAPAPLLIAAPPVYDFPEVNREVSAVIDGTTVWAALRQAVARDGRE